MEKNNAIQVRKSTHRGTDIWELHFPYDAKLVQLVRGCGGVKWSHSKRCWYGPGTEAFLLLLKSHVDCIVENDESPPLIAESADNPPAKSADEPLNAPQEIHRQVEKFIRQMETERLSKSTVKTYSDALRIFLEHIHPSTPEQVSNEDVNRFLHQYAFQRKLSISWHRTLISALKLYFRRFEGRKLDPEHIRYPKKDKLLPHVLDQKDIEKMLRLTTNIKHRCMLSLIYACGLRRGDLLNLKPQDIDGKRQQLFIRGGKGRKDRIVRIPPKMIEALRDYYKEYRPKFWLFEGQKSGEKYSERSIQLVMKQALERAGLRTDASLHWLRHSFATHTLENGVDITYIKEMLGHSSIRTTEIYTHVSNEKMRQIRSPFEDLDL